MHDAPERVFLLSPAHCGGRRAQLLLNEAAEFPLAQRIRSSEGAPLGEVFSFLSGLYFRGKLTYARRFGRRIDGRPHTLVITANRGLMPPEAPVGISDLCDFGTVDIAADEHRYRAPLARDAAAIANNRRPSRMPPVVLLGSIATGKYVDVLLEVLGEHLLFPSAFVGRGDMSRGAILLRAAREGTELDYQPVAGAVRSGRSAPRIEDS